MQEQDIQTLAQAFIEKSSECGVKLFPETAEGLAREVFEQHSKDKIVPIESLVAEKFGIICGKTANASLNIVGLSKLSSSIDELMIKIAQASGSGPLTPQEIEEWRQRVIDDVYVPFQNIGLEIAAKAREIMAEFEKLSKQHYDLEKTYKGKVKEATVAFEEMSAADKNQQASPTRYNEQAYDIKRKKYVAYKDSLISIAEEMVKIKSKMHGAQAMLVYLTGTSDYIKETIKVPENFGAKLDGGSTFLKQMKIALGDIKRVISAIKTGKSRIDVKSLAIDSIERLSVPHWMLKALSNNATTAFQTSSIGPSVDKLEIEDFEKGSWTSFGQKNVLWEKIKQQYNDLPHEEQQKKYYAQLEVLKKQNQALFSKINNLPNTWKKFREIYEVLDPQSPKQAAELYSAAAETPEAWMAEETKQQGATPTAEEIESNKIAKEYLNKKNPRAWGLIRKLAEIQNPQAHWSILYVLSNLNDVKYDKNSGKTYGEEFLDSLPSEKKSDPVLLDVAQKIDGFLSDKRREYALQVILNPNTPDWILMKLASIGYRSVGATDKIQKEKDEAYDFIRKVAYEMLQKRGWKLKRGSDGKPVSHKFGPHDVGFEFEKEAPKTASSKNKTVVAQTNSALNQLQSQMEGLDRQLTGLEKQMSDLRNRKGQLQRQISAEQERLGQIQQADEKAKAQKAMSDAAQPSSNQAPGAGIGTGALGMQ